jgi:hypothetical protein
MWPDLMGPEWQWHLLATVGLLTALFAALWLVDRAAKTAFHEEPASPDPLLMLWHRYEVGDLTRREFERQRAALAPRTPLPQGLLPQSPAMDRAAHHALNGNARPAGRGAAAGAKAT